MLTYLPLVIGLAALGVVLQVVAIVLSQNLGKGHGWYRDREELFLLLWEFLLNGVLLGLAFTLGGYFLG